MRRNTFSSCTRSVAILAFAMFSTVAHAQGATQIYKKVEPTKLAEAIPPAVQRLFEWPEDSILNGPKRLDSDTTYPVQFAKTSSGDSIRKVLDPSWQPPKDTKPYLIRHEFESRDTMRLRWLKDNYIVQVAETSSIFTIKITPRDGSDLGTDSVARTAIARQLCLDVFAKEGIRYTVKGDLVKIHDLNRKIASVSFDPMSIKSLDQGATSWGEPKGQPRDGTQIAADPAETVEKRSRDDDPANPNWIYTDRAWLYWFHLVFWENDGKSVGFYLAKMSGGGPTYPMGPMSLHDASLFFHSPGFDPEWFDERPTAPHTPTLQEMWGGRSRGRNQGGH